MQQLHISIIVESLKFYVITLMCACCHCLCVCVCLLSLCVSVSVCAHACPLPLCVSNAKKDTCSKRHM